jgi:hypothetical protein
VIAPYKEPRPFRPVAWLVDRSQALDENGDLCDVVELADGGTHVWAEYDLVMDLLRQEVGEALCWDNRPLRWSPLAHAKTWPVRVLALPTPGDPERCLAGLRAWRDWLNAYGAAPQGSLGGSAFSLLRATLNAPLWTNVGERPPIRFTLGGRQELGPHGAPAIFEGALRHYDLPAAYARTLGEMRYGGWWLKAPSRWRFDLEDQNGTLVFVNARVRVPELAYGPLPERPRRQPASALEAQLSPVAYPVGRTMQGTWTWAELVQAEAAGCTIERVLAGWVHSTRPDSYPFWPWWQAVRDGRRMDGFAGLLAKATGNALWGQFAIRRSRRSVLRRDGGERVERTLGLKGGGNPSQRAPDLAETVSGRVRAQLHAAMMRAGDRLVSAHTDGVWAFDDPKLRLPGWRSKGTTEYLRLITPQELAYVLSDGSQAYVVAGVRSQETAEFFEAEWARLVVERSGRPHALRELDREPAPVPLIQVRPLRAARARPRARSGAS